MYAEWNLERAQISGTSRRKSEITHFSTYIKEWLSLSAQQYFVINMYQYNSKNMGRVAQSV